MTDEKEKKEAGLRILIRKYLVESLKNPTGKQKEAYGRFLHTLSAGSFIGAVTVAFSGAGIEYWFKTGVLVFLGITLFFVAAYLSKGD